MCHFYHPLIFAKHVFFVQYIFLFICTFFPPLSPTTTLWFENVLCSTYSTVYIYMYIHFIYIKNFYLKQKNKVNVFISIYVYPACLPFQMFGVEYKFFMIFHKGCNIFCILYGYIIYILHVNI